MSKVERDALIATIIEVLEEEITTDAVLHFHNAAAIADVLISRYKIKTRSAAG